MFCLFRKKSIGIDIADHRIWVTRLARSGGAFLIDSLKGVKLKSGVVENGRIKNKKELAKAINSLLGELQAESSCEKRIVFSLPKNQVYVHVFTDTSGDTDRKYLDKVVKKDTEESIPLDSSDLYYNYKILNKTPEQTNILVMAVSKELIYEWQEFFNELKVDVQVYDLSSLASFRNLYRRAPKKPICMVDIGGDSTSITVFNNKGLRYSHAIRIAGESFTERIADDMKISFEEADKVKIKNGLVKDQEVFESLNSELKKIVKTVGDISDYLKAKTEEDIEKIILIGGSSLMKGLPAYLEKEIGKPVELGQPLISAGKKSFEHLTSVGLALRGFEKRSRQKDPGLLPIEKDKRKTKIEEKAKTFEEDIESNTNFSDEVVEQVLDDKKIKKQKITLLIILIIGLVLLGGAFWYRNLESNKRQSVGVGDTSLYPYENKIVLQVPVAIDKSEYANDRAEGRLSETNELSLKSDESLWPEPVFLSPSRWLVYSQSEIESIIFANIKEKIGNNFSLASMDYNTIVYSDNRNLLFLEIEIELYSEEQIDSNDFVILGDETSTEVVEEVVEEEIAVEEAEKAVENFLRVESAIGWLNVREGAGQNFPIIQKINSGEEYVYVSEDNAWYEIVLGEEETGWVSGDYVELIN